MTDLAVVENADSLEGDAPPDPEPPSKRAFAARQGILLLRDNGETGRSVEQALAAVCDALKADSRVKGFDRPAHREHAARRDVMYPRIRRVAADSALVGDDHFHSLRFSDPIVFELAVPAANQKPFRGSSDFPVGNYFVAWDGVAVVVGWDQQSNQRVSRAAGRVALEVLSEATERAGFSTYLQACSPGCQNGFTHTDALIVEENSARPRNTFGLLVIERPVVHSAEIAIVEWYEQIAYRCFLFAVYKNHARRILDLHGLADQMLQQLLHLRQQRQLLANTPWRKRRGARKPLKRWRKTSRKYVADVWLAAASIELGRGQWDEKRRRFNERTAKSLVREIFERDVKDDEAAVDGIDLDFARAALEYSAARFDAQILAAATGLAGASGIIGGVVGAAIGS